MNHHRGPRVWQVAVWRGRLRRLIAAGWQALITLRWRLLRRWRMIDPRCQGPRDAAHSWRTTARAPRRRHRCTRLVDLANASCFCTHFCKRTLHRNRTKLDRVNSWRIRPDVVSPVERAISLSLLLIYFSFAHVTAESRCFNATYRINEYVPCLESQNFARFIIAEMSLKSPDVTDSYARLHRNCDWLNFFFYNCFIYNFKTYLLFFWRS